MKEFFEKAVEDLESLSNSEFKEKAERMGFEVNEAGKGESEES